jgi:FdhE protein
MDRPGVSPDLVRLEEALCHLRNDLTATLGSDYPPEAPEESRLAAALAAGTALARIQDPLPPDELLADAGRRLAAALEAHLAQTPRLLAALRGDGDSAAPPLAAWFTAAWRGDRATLIAQARAAEADVDLLTWVGRQLCRPFLHAFAGAIRDAAALSGEWPMVAGCPSCGGAPRLGRYAAEEGRRTLWCELCDVEWGFPRVTCPFCLNRDHEKLGFLTVEGVEGYRIDVCEVCHGYLRAIDERDTARVSGSDFLIEDVGTVHLCMAAERDGFRTGSLTPVPERPAGGPA